MSNDHSSLASTDIMLLMENYQNIMQMNAILQQQQKQLIDLQNKLLTTQTDISKTQVDTVNQIEKIIEKLSDCACNIQEISKILKSNFDDIEDSIMTKLEYNDKSVSDLKIDNIKQSNSINKNVNGAWIGMGTIIVAIIALFIASYDKFASLDKIHKLLEQIVKYFNIG